MTPLSELNDFDNNIKVIDAMSDEQRREWYLRIKESLPMLQKSFSANQMEQLGQAIAAYEQRHGLV